MAFRRVGRSIISNSTGYFLVSHYLFVYLRINRFCRDLKLYKYMKTIYERPEAEELKLVLENTILSGDMENPTDPGNETEI